MESDPKAPIETIKKVLQNKNLSRNHETWFAVGICLRMVDNQELRKEIYDCLADLVSNPSEFLLLIYYLGELKAQNIGFGHGSRRFISKWYESKTAIELVDLFSSHRSLYGMHHRTIVKLAKVKLEDPQKQEILQTLFTKNKNLVPKEDSSEAFKRLCSYQKLKRAVTPEEVLEILKKKELDYKLEHLPPFALNSVKVWEQLLPTISVKTILENLVKMQSHKMLGSESFAKKLALAFGSYKVKEKLNPVFVLFVLRAYEIKCRFQELLKKKQEEKSCENEEKQEKKEIKELNPFLVKKIYSVLNVTLAHIPKAGVRYHITIDFRKFSQKHSSPFNNHQVDCFEAQVLLALTFLKSEKEVVVSKIQEHFEIFIDFPRNFQLFTFTNEKKVLAPVEFTKETTFEKGLEIYQEKIVSICCFLLIFHFCDILFNGRYSRFFFEK